MKKYVLSFITIICSTHASITLASENLSNGQNLTKRYHISELSTVGTSLPEQRPISQENALACCANRSYLLPVVGCFTAELVYEIMCLLSSVPSSSSKTSAQDVFTFSSTFWAGLGLAGLGVATGLGYMITRRLIDKNKANRRSNAGIPIMQIRESRINIEDTQIPYTGNQETSMACDEHKMQYGLV